MGRNGEERYLPQLAKSAGYIASHRDVWQLSCSAFCGMSAKPRWLLLRGLAGRFESFEQVFVCEDGLEAQFNLPIAADEKTVPYISSDKRREALSFNWRQLQERGAGLIQVRKVSDSRGEGGREGSEHVLR